MVLFLFALFCILFFTAKLRLHPFLSLVLVSVFTGILAGEPLATVEAITGGLGSVFSRFAIIITCGSVIGILLQGTGGMSLIASDIICFSRNPLLALNVLGFLFSVPMMCYILAYVIFIPIAKELASRLDNPPISTATALALGAVASFNLVYPSPVVISAAEELSANVDRLFILGLFIAVPTSIAGYLYSKNLEKSGTADFSNRVKEKTAEVQEKASGIYNNSVERPRRLEVYSPIFFPLLLILLQTGFEHPHPVLTFLGNPNIALLIGVLLSIFSGRKLGSLVLRELIEKAVRRTGVVLLDLCGGGALGATLAMTGAGGAIGRFFLQLSLPPYPCAFFRCRSPPNRSGIKDCDYAYRTFSFTASGS
nr:GntP family permease [Methanosarcina sp. UBA5]